MNKLQEMVSQISPVNEVWSSLLGLLPARLFVFVILWADKQPKVKAIDNSYTYATDQEMSQ